MDLLYALAAVASAVAALLAWIAKIRWSKEFVTAKNEIIQSKDAQIALLEREIQGLRELTPMKIREYFLSVREQLEEYNETLKKDLEKAHIEIRFRDTKLNELRKIGGDQAERMQILEEERDRLKQATEKLEISLAEYKEGFSKAEEEASKDTIFDQPKIFQDVNQNWRNLRNYMSHQAHRDLKADNLITTDYWSFFYIASRYLREQTRHSIDVTKEHQSIKDSDHKVPNYEELEKELNEYLEKKYGDRIRSHPSKDRAIKDPSDDDKK
jgi:hypothetical protein